MCKGPFTNICKGEAWCKKFLSQKFLPPPLQTSKNFRASLFAMKITGQPCRKACKLNFHWKICGNFFKAPLIRFKTLRAPLFASGPLNKWLWMVPDVISNGCLCVNFVCRCNKWMIMNHQLLLWHLLKLFMAIKICINYECVCNLLFMNKLFLSYLFMIFMIGLHPVCW